MLREKIQRIIMETYILKENTYHTYYISIIFILTWKDYCDLDFAYNCLIFLFNNQLFQDQLKIVVYVQRKLRQGKQRMIMKTYILK